MSEPSANSSCTLLMASCVLIPKWDAKSSSSTTLVFCRVQHTLSPGQLKTCDFGFRVTSMYWMNSCRRLRDWRNTNVNTLLKKNVGDWREEVWGETWSSVNCSSSPWSSMINDALSFWYSSSSLRSCASLARRSSSSCSGKPLWDFQTKHRQSLTIKKGREDFLESMFRKIVPSIVPALDETLV